MSKPDYLLLDKPSGISTHGPTPEIPGYIEYLEQQHKEKLWICHRLDRGTSGALIMATSKAAAAHLADQFEAGTVRKKYLLVTDRPGPASGTGSSRSDIERVRGEFISTPSATGSAHTTFRRLSQNAKWSLWEAIPLTGKPHQIRLHAKEIGIPILGDDEHGGSAHVRLFLHAAEIAFRDQAGKDILHQVPAPEIFFNLPLLDDEDLCRMQLGLDRRKRWELDAYRLLHRELPGIRADRFGQVLWVYWYHDNPPTKEDQQRVATLASAAQCADWRIQIMGNRGKKPDRFEIIPAEPLAPWTITEHGLQYILKADQGLSRGLFLDQRANRKWFLENSKDKRVLNLFCYTGGFSLCAARGGASEVVSVDTSKQTLTWAKENFLLNDLKSDQYQFWDNDASYFLRGAKRRGREFDLIICDPPSFSRSSEGVFRIEQNLPELLDQCLAVLAPNGRLLFSTNYEGWTKEHFKEVVLKSLPRGKFATEATPIPDLDFEMPGEDPLMKSVFVTRL